MKQNQAHNVAWLYKMHELYYNGIPDKYDNLGNKIKGVEPDPNKAIEYLQKACALGQNPLMWLKLASIYQNGMYKLEPQLQTAAQYYRQIMQNFPYRDIYLEASEQLDNVQQESNNIATYRWLNLKYTPKKNAHHDKIAKMLRTQGQGGGAAVRPVVGEVVAARDLFRTNNTNTVLLGQDFGDLVRQDPNNAVILDPNDRRRNDAHNTHNSQVVSTVANSLKKLKGATTLTMTPAGTVRALRSYIGSKPNCDKKEDAFKSLDSIERNIIPVSSVNMKEIDALNIVWNRINEDHNDNSDDLKEILYGQLADMQEHGKSVCATGRLERVVDTLSTFDNNVAIKPTYVINDEMMLKASQIHEDMLKAYEKEHGEARLKLMEEGRAPDQMEYENKIKKSITDGLQKDYVDSGILTQEKFQAQVDKWIDDVV